MSKQTQSEALRTYIRSLKEIESFVASSHRPKLSISSDAPAASIPELWREVFHMARIGPGLLACLQECQSLLSTTHASAMEGVLPDLLAGMNGAALIEDMGNVLEYCERVIEVANVGAAPVDRTLH